MTDGEHHLLDLVLATLVDGQADDGVRLAASRPAGTVRGDFCVSMQENIIHTSDSPENAVVELNRFFKPEELFEYKKCSFDYLYANDEC